jgi:RHS repeat-associated protein
MIKNGAVTLHHLFNGCGGGLFAHDEQGHLAGECKLSTSKPMRETVHLGDPPVAVLAQTVTGTAPIQVTAANVFPIHPDHLGTPRMITRASVNKIVWRWDNGDPFGAAAPTGYFSGSATFRFNLRMPGQYDDRNVNLFCKDFRDYDPQAGRYILSDPIGLEGGINPYLYVRDNPLALHRAAACSRFPYGEGNPASSSDPYSPLMAAAIARPAADMVRLEVKTSDGHWQRASVTHAVQAGQDRLE